MQPAKSAKVNGRSMQPLLRDGDIVLYKQSVYSSGDIILFKYGEFNLTHRLIKIDNHLVTKGDNIPSWDKYINKCDVMGVAEYVIRKDRVICLTNRRVNQRFLN